VKKANKAKRMQTDSSPEKAQMPEEMGTLFIMDLLRQKREKALRQKKDEMILKMALEQKKKMSNKNQDQSNRYSSGGFIGIAGLTKNAGGRKVQQAKEKSDEDEHVAIKSDNEMFILGLLKEQRQEKMDKERKEICEKSLGCASDENSRRKFEP